MLNRTQDVVQFPKITTSFHAPRTGSTPFGDNPARVGALDNLATEDYDERLAYLMAVVSAWSYADEKTLAGKLRYYGMPGARIRRISVQNNALLVASTAYLIQSESGKSAILAFRGTDPGNYITFLTDAQVMQQAFFGTRVHAGFHASVEVVWDEVHEALKAARNAQHIDTDGKEVKLDERLQNLYVTGHSLGGAMALLAAARLSQDDYKDWNMTSLLKGIYTFGQPMVGNQSFADLCENAFGEKLFRHVYHADVVPHLPPRSGIEYVHAGEERRSENLAKPWNDPCVASTRARLALALAEVLVNALEARLTSKDVFPGFAIDDHAPMNYVQVCRSGLKP
jgi:Lipase (class 3)